MEKNEFEQMNINKNDEPELNQENHDNLESSEADLNLDNTEDLPESYIDKTAEPITDKIGNNQFKEKHESRPPEIGKDIAKPSLGRRIRKMTELAGLSALSMMPGDKNIGNKLIANDQTKNRIEWERSDLEKNGGAMKEMAYMLAEEEVTNKEKILFLENRINFIKDCINENFEELKYRESHGSSSEEYTNTSTEYLEESIEEWKIYLKEDEAELTKLRNLVGDQIKLSDDEIQKQINEINKSIFYYDLGRKWVLDNIDNPEYFERLKKEGSKDLPNLSFEDVKKYVEKWQAYRFLQVRDDNFVISKDIQKSYESSGGDSTMYVGGFYRPTNQKVYFPLNQDSLSSIELAIHEYTHKVTKANYYIPLNSIKLFIEAFDSSSVMANYGTIKELSGRKSLEYLSDPTEMYARKKVFEYDLERLGVKKYGEEFTKEHYLKVLELKRKRQLSGGSCEFILSIKPEMMERVMNEIAAIGLNQEEVENIT